MICPDRVAHAVLKVRDLEVTRQFYHDVLGLQVVKTYPEENMLFMSCNPQRDHHEVAFLEIGPQAQGPRADEIGLYHLAFRLQDWAHLQRAYGELRDKQVPIVGTINHGITRSVYFKDPDGHTLEVYCDNPRWREVIKINRADQLVVEGPEPDPLAPPQPSSAHEGAAK